MMFRVLSIHSKVSRVRRVRIKTTTRATTVRDILPIEEDPKFCRQLIPESEEPYAETINFTHNVHYHWYNEQTIIILLVSNESLLVDTIIAQVRYRNTPQGQFDHVPTDRLKLFDCPPGRRVSVNQLLKQLEFLYR